MSCRSENGNRMAVEMQAGGGLYLLFGQGRLSGNWQALPGRIRWEAWNQHTPLFGPYWVHVTAMPGSVEIGTDRCVFA